MAALSEREKIILYAAVSEFVQNGTPVGSRTISNRGIDLSPATIRNVLSSLEDAGYLKQPHTSAGRVPTDSAFRLFIDALMELRELPPEEHERIRAHIGDLSHGVEGLRETGRFLSEMTGAAAVVIAPRGTSTLRHLRFIRTMPGEMLAVLVLADGTVQNRFFKANVSEEELVRVHNLLDDVVEGRTLTDLRDFFIRKLAAERVRGDALRRTAYELGEAALGAAPPANAAGARAQELVIEGRVRLLERPEFSHADDLKQVVSALDDEDKLVRLIDNAQGSAKQVAGRPAAEAGGAAVLVGKETGELAGGQLAVVTAPYSSPTAAQGTVAVIGPTRMDYPKVVPIVAATAVAMTELYERGERRDGADRRDDDDDP
ncbi:MAG: heat-inducible transcriptional repressor HrcA [Polyangiaceae bacterium]